MKRTVIDLSTGLVSVVDLTAEELASLPALQAPASPASISPRQIRQVLTAAGLRASVESMVAAGDQDLKDWWMFSTAFEREHPVLVSMALALGLSAEQVEDLFEQASII